MTNLQRGYAAVLPSTGGELTDHELDDVSGGSFLTEMAGAGVQRAARRVAQTVGRCPPNHNGVR